MVTKVTDKEQYDKILAENTDKLIVVYYSATW